MNLGHNLNRQVFIRIPYVNFLTPTKKANYWQKLRLGKFLDIYYAIEGTLK